MEMWQEIAISRVMKVDFIKEEDKIKKAFTEILGPILGFQGISMIDDNTLKIGANLYRLNIDSTEITLRVRTVAKDYSIAYVANENGQGYRLPGKIIDFSPITTPNFSYTKILNELMNIGIVL